MKLSSNKKAVIRVAINLDGRSRVESKVMKTVKMIMIYWLKLDERERGRTGVPKAQKLP